LSEIVEIGDLIEEIVMPKVMEALMMWLEHRECEVSEVWMWY